MTENGETPRSVFDDLTAVDPVGNDTPPIAAGQPESSRPSAQPRRSDGPGGGEPPATPLRIKQTAQELLRLGVLYKSAKPNLYQIALTNRDAIANVLEPLDLTLRIDDVRGLVILAVTPVAVDLDGDGEKSDSDEWNHPLVRRQRLTLAQSLLVALLRRHYVDHEKTGTGVAPPRVAVEDLVPELQPYLGDEGSDAGEQSRVRRLLEQLKEYGIVSPIGEDDMVTIRPLICHLADPDSLQTLLHHYEAMTATSQTEPVR